MSKNMDIMQLQNLVCILLITYMQTLYAATYNYNEVLQKSLLFYEAQRTGRLPANNRVKWRGNSFLNDKDGSRDLTGGYFDAGDFMKFGFPMASAMTVLTWGAIQYRQGYAAAGQTSHIAAAVKWGADYLVKCNTGTNEYIVQVGDGKLDHKYWGRPEEQTMARPVFKATTSRKASDVVGESAAALAAASILFKNTDSNLSGTYLKNARTMYEFAKNYRGKYSDWVKDAKEFYESSNECDEVAFAAAWLYKATKETKYLRDAESLYSQCRLGNRPHEFSWSEKTPGVQVLMAELTGKQTYKDNVKQFCDYATNIKRVRGQGLIFLSKWGTLRYAANIAFICEMAADMGINTDKYRKFAMQQIHAALGDMGRSYVVGFGRNPPLRAHHAAASCPNKPAKCDWDNYKSTSANPHVLQGALVGGPNENNQYKDERSDYIANEVTLDYNAGFQSAVAGLKQWEATGKLPSSYL